jgi:hypothetical protein
LACARPPASVWGAPEGALLPEEASAPLAELGALEPLPVKVVTAPDPPAAAAGVGPEAEPLAEALALPASGPLVGVDEAAPVGAADGLTVDGLTADGLTADGLTADGLTADGLTADGLTADGLTVDGLTPDGALDPTPPGIAPPCPGTPPWAAVGPGCVTLASLPPGRDAATDWGTGMVPLSPATVPPADEATPAAFELPDASACVPPAPIPGPRPVAVTDGAVDSMGAGAGSTRAGAVMRTLQSTSTQAPCASVQRMIAT